MNNNNSAHSLKKSHNYFIKLVYLVKANVRIQVILAFAFCILFSLLVFFIASPFFVSQDRQLDFTQGIVMIDEQTRDLRSQLNRAEQDLHTFVTELGQKNPDFKEKYLNRSIPASKKTDDWITIPLKDNSVYRLTKKEFIQFILDSSSNEDHFDAFITDLAGKILFKTAEVKETQVNIDTLKSDAENSLVVKTYEDPSLIEKKHETPIVTRLYPLTLHDRNHYLIVRGLPSSTTVYVKETGVIPYLLGLITFILCFYLITKRKMREIEEIALGLMEIAKGNLHYRIREKSQDEVGSLATNINYMAAELFEMIERQRQTEKLKDELITNVSHDLRTPLTSIMGYLRLVKDQQYKNQSQLNEYVDIAYGKSEQLKKLVEDLFDFTRFTHRGVQLKKERVSLNQMIRQLIDEFDPIAKENEVTFNTDLPKIPIMLEVDPNQMVRALENILTNAIKYSTPPGNIEVKLIKNKQTVEISVSNPCESLSKDEVMRLFDRFYRVDPSRSSQKSGAGLGLAITKSIIELHHGTIQADYKNRIIQLTIRLPFYSSERAL